MESLQSIKQRIRGVKNINQITKAMEMVAATKMRRSQEVALGARAYAFAALDLLASLSRMDGVVLPPLLEKRAGTRRAFVLVVSDKGLAGSFNSSVIREFEKALRTENIDLRDPDVHVIAVGQKAAAYLERRTEGIAARFTRVGDFTTPDETTPLAKLLIDGYLSGRWDSVTIFSTHFHSALRQEVMRRHILPVEFQNIRRTAQELVPDEGRYSGAEAVGAELPPAEYIIEPSPEAVLADLAEHLVAMQIYHLILEANASEHAARRMAMKSASDNAEELAGELTLAYNKSRQAAITKEIIEITAGAESIQQ